MKIKIISLVIVLAVFSNNIFCNELKYEQQGYVSFEIPSSPNLEYESYPKDASNVFVWVNSILDREVQDWSTSVFSPLLYDVLVEDNLRINKSHILELLKTNNVQESKTFSLAPNWYVEYGEIIYSDFLIESYEPFLSNGQIIGECYLDVPKHAGSVTFNIYLIAEDRIVIFDIGIIHFPFDKVIEKYPEWFDFTEDGSSSFKNYDCQLEFYKILNSEKCKEFGSKAELLVQTKNTILSTLKVYEKPSFHSGNNWHVSENLLLRAGEGTDANVITTIKKGSEIKILEIGKPATIDGLNSNWVKIHCENRSEDKNGRHIQGKTGWCFGGYLK